MDKEMLEENVDEIIETLVNSGDIAFVDQLLAMLHEARSSMALDNLDPEAIIANAFSSGFASNGQPKPPMIFEGGVIALLGTVQDTSKDRHHCTLYTVRMDIDSPNEYWQWSDSPTLIASETVKVDRLRRTVSLHALPEGALVIKHVRQHDGERHVSKSVSAYCVEHEANSDGEIVGTNLRPASSSVIRRLPSPEESEW